jgi:transcriptional regulator with XRE-family HTH domain
MDELTDLGAGRKGVVPWQPQVRVLLLGVESDHRGNTVRRFSRDADGDLLRFRNQVQLFSGGQQSCLSRTFDGQTRKQLTRLEGLLAEKAGECSRVVALYRRGRLTDADLDGQMDEIGKEETALEAQIAELRSKVAGADSIGATISSVEALFGKLRSRLNEPVSWEQKRRLVEVLVAGVRVETVEECGVKQARTTVTYQFSQPDEPMVVLPQSYATGQVVRIPKRPLTVGDHIRRKRLSLKLEQKEVAERIGVHETSVFNWEANAKRPDLRFMPKVIEFLGYNPLPMSEGIGGRLVRRRTSLGMTQKEAAKSLAVDPSTLARWERGERAPVGRARRSVEGFLDEDGPGVESWQVG